MTTNGTTSLEGDALAFFQCLEGRNEPRVTSTCGQTRFEVHLKVLENDSKAMAAAFKHGSFPESQTKEIHLVDEDESMVQRWVNHMYCGKYSPDPLTGQTDVYVSAIEVHVQMYKMAEKWDAKDLLNYAFRQFQRYANSSSNDHIAFIYKVIPLIYSFASPKSELRQWLVWYGQVNIEFYQELEMFDAKEVAKWLMDMVDRYAEHPKIELCGDCLENTIKTSYTCSCGMVDDDHEMTKRARERDRIMLERLSIR